MTPQPLLQVKDLSKYFAVTRSVLMSRKIGDIKAVDRVSFDIFPGETLGLVGESGCGKTTLGRALLRLVEPTGGRVMLRDVDVTALRPGDLRRARRHMQMIFQDPYASLDPRMTVGQIIAEPIDTFGLARGAARQARIRE